MNWSDAGSWLKDNAGPGATLVGSLLTGNVPGAIAAGISLVSSATGTDDPAKALVQFQENPETLVRLKEIAQKEEESVREHIRAMKELELVDMQKEQEEQQKTIRSGDNAEDPYVRKTRPLMARQSWYATMVYVIGIELLHGFKVVEISASWDLAMILVAPAGAYLGFRSWDKKNEGLQPIRKI